MLSKKESLAKLEESANYVETHGLSKERAPVVENCDLSDLSNKELKKFDLTMIKYRNCNFSNSDFTNLNLKDSRFGAKCVFNNTNFSKTDLHGANFSNVDLENAKLYGAIVGKSYYGSVTNFTAKALNTIEDDNLYDAIKLALSNARKTKREHIIAKPKGNSPSNQVKPSKPSFIIKNKISNNNNRTALNVGRNIEKLLSNNSNNSKTKKTKSSKKRSRCPNGTRKNPKNGKCQEKKK